MNCAYMIVELRVYDSTGCLLLQSNIDTNRLIEVNTSNWSNGIYQVVIPEIGTQTVIINR